MRKRSRLASRVSLARGGAEASGGFHDGLRLALISLLTAPDFVFRIERGYPNAAGGIDLDPWSRASRISYLLWDSLPDEELLAAAESGALSSRAGLEAQVARLVASPRIEDGTRAFFADLLHLELFDGLNKDASQYPKFSQAVAASAREQTLKVLVDHLATKRGDYREIFTTRDSFINRPLGSVYQVPFASNGEWMRYTFDEASGQSGVLTQVAFFAVLPPGP